MLCLVVEILLDNFFKLVLVLILDFDRKIIKKKMGCIIERLEIIIILVEELKNKGYKYRFMRFIGKVKFLMCIL